MRGGKHHGAKRTGKKSSVVAAAVISTAPVKAANTEETSSDSTIAEQTLQNGWIEIDGFYYYEKDGEIQYDQFISEGNDVYYVNNEGKMAAGEEFYSTSDLPQ